MAQQVYTLLVEVGRKPDDGLPDGATGAALVCYATGVDQDEAVRETVAILKQAELAPLEVQGYGTLADRLAQEGEIPPEERALMDRALAEISRGSPERDGGSAPSFQRPFSTPRCARTSRLRLASAANGLPVSGARG